MAAIHPDDVHRSGASSTRATARGEHGAFIGRFACVVTAFACAVLGLMLTRGYPIAPQLAAAAFVAWTAFAAWRFSYALPALIAAVPVVGFATWTGWLTFEEVDLLVLASAAGGYASRAFVRTRPDRSARSHQPMLSIFSIVLLALFLVATAVSLQRGVVAAGGWHVGFFDGYDGALNGLRIFKSFAFALLIAPLVIGELRSPGGFDRIGLGFTIALALASLAVLRERLAFTGLLDFSDDYRVTGGFWEMHVGGAALDGFLVLTLPFAIREAIRESARSVSPVRFVAAMAVVGLAAYAMLVTFSRGVYAAAPVAIIVLAVLLSRRGTRSQRGATWALFGQGIVLTALVAVGTFFVFRHGGYRSVTAVLAALALAIVGDAALRRLRPVMWVVALVAAAVAVALGAVFGAVPKGPYLVFAAAFFATGAAIFLNERKPSTAASTAVAGAWLWMTGSAVQVAAFWGGSSARDDSLVVSGLLVLLVFVLSRRVASTWPATRRSRLATIGFAALVVASVSVFTGGAYMGDRFAASRSNLDERIGHWRRGIDRLHGSDWWFGKGLGRFPATSIFEAVDGAGQGRYGLTTRDGATFLTLTGPHLPYLGFDELFRVSQRVSPEPGTRYVATIVVHVDAPTGFHIELCEKQLLYTAGCRSTDVAIAPVQAGLQKIVFPFDSGEIGTRHWYGKRPVFFAVGVGDPTKVVDIRSMQLVAPDGTDLLANGDFRNRTARWFTQSDKYHLPWHIKNIVLDVLFDQGLIGLALFTLLAAGALIRTAVGRARRHPDAPYVAAALAGYGVVGAFDSLLDVPRVAFLFYLLVVVGLALRNPRVASTARTPPQPLQQAVPVDPAAEAAARALRRQQAFGERRRTGPEPVANR